MTTPFPGPALLFCPADRPDRYAKAAARADMVILDLEDAVSAEHKVAARSALLAYPINPERTIVRINAFDSAEHSTDLATLRMTEYQWLMLPKAERREDVESLDSWRVVALCETARGIVNAADIASAPNVAAMMWGAEDLMASLQGRTSRFPDGTYRHVANHARASVLLSAASAGVAAIDAVYLDTNDVTGLAMETEDAAATGFKAKACIHPRQVSVVRQAFLPSERDVQWARRVLAGPPAEQGVFIVNGQMIDAPLMRQAEEILQRADPA